MAIKPALVEVNGLYTVETKQLYTIDIIDEAPVFTPSNKWTIRRTDDIVYHFGYCGKVWKPIQNIQAFSLIGDYIDKKELQIENLGVLVNGAICYMLCRLNINLEMSNETIRAYLLVSNHHDGQTSIRFAFVPIRVRNYTTLSMACTNRQEHKIFRIRHSGQTDYKLEDTALALDLMVMNFQETLKLYQKMEKIQLDDSQLVKFVNFAFKLVDGEDHDVHNAIRLRQGDSSLWAIYNGICEHVNFHIGNYNQTRRIFKLWFGQNSAITERAIDYALRIVNEHVR